MIEKFLEYLTHEKRFSDHTILSYSNDLKQFFDFIQETEMVVEDQVVNHLHIRSWVVFLLDSDVSSRSVNRKLSSLKSYFKFLRSRGWMTSNPMLKVVAPKVGKRLPNYVSEFSMDLMQQELVFNTDFSGIRDQCIVELFYGTGIRQSELINLHLSDVDHSAKVIKVLGKGKKERIVPLMPELYKLICKYIEMRNSSSPASNLKTDLFLTDKSESLYPKLVYNIVKRHLSKVTTIEQRSPHVLRHTFATHLSNNGADIKAVKELLGHASLAATQVYTHNSIERLRVVYEQAFPRTDEV
ncbi:MAG: tyrosine-type recombinase/integrase [Saprospiraceae bacterium]